MSNHTKRGLFVLSIHSACVMLAAAGCSIAQHSWVPVAGVTFGFLISGVVTVLTIGLCKLADKIWSDNDE
jgi:hypothetical protein